MLRIIFITASTLLPAFSFSPSINTNSPLPTLRVSRIPSHPWGLSAKKSAAGKGFGKSVEKVMKIPPNDDDSFSSNDSATTNYAPLESVEGSTPTNTRPLVNLDPNADTDERSQQILRERFGLKTYEEQQGDIAKEEKRKEQKERMKKLKKMADAENLDVFQLIPAPLLKAIDSFLKLGLGISVVLFVLAGVAITVEAWSHATGGVIPDNVDDFIVTVVEPNFTIGGLVLLAFSVSLGIFAAAQLGSESSQYQEKP